MIAGGAVFTRLVFSRNLATVGISGVAQIVGYAGAHKTAFFIIQIEGDVAPQGSMHLISGRIGIFLHEAHIRAGLQGGRIGEIAIEAQEGDAQIYVILAVQVNKALHISAAGEPLVIVFLFPLCQGHCGGDLHRLTGRDCDLAIGGAVGNVRIQLPGILIGQMGDLAVLHQTAHSLLAQDGGVQGIGFVGIGEIHHLKGHLIYAGALRIVAQLQLGLVGALHLDVGLRVHGRTDVDHTGALAADEVEGTVLFIQNGGSRRHQQTVGHMGIVLFRDIGILQILPHQSGAGSHGGRGHAGTGGNTHPVAIGGQDVAADAGDLRLQGQTAGGAPGGEIRHLPCRLASVPEAHNSYGVALNITFDHIKKGRPKIGDGKRKFRQSYLGTIQQNQTGSFCFHSLVHQFHRVNILAHRAEEQFALGVCRIFCELKFPVAQLLPETFALRHTDHLGVVTVVFISKSGHISEGVSAIECSCVLRAGHGQRRVKGARHSNGAGIHRGGLDHIVAPEAAPATEVAVAGRNRYTDAGFIGGIKDLAHAFHIGGTAGGTQGQIGTIHT